LKNYKTNVFFRKDFFQYDLPVVVERKLMHPEDFLPLDTLNQRQFWKIFYVISGCGKMIFNQYDYPIHPGVVCLNHPNDRTNITTQSSLELYHVLFLSDPILPELRKFYDNNDFFRIFDHCSNPELALSHIQNHLFDSNRAVHRHIRNMYIEYQRNDANSATMLRLQLLQLLLLLSRLSIRRSSHIRRNDLVRNVHSYLQAHISEKCDTAVLADQLGISRSWLLATYRRTAGTSIAQTMLDLRLERASEMLQYKKHTIDHVCFLCGFRDMSAFYRKFRTKFGMTPNQFRKKFPSE
jgi:AraC-like DNA-binding protein